MSVDDRNEQQANLLSSEYQRRNDHIFAEALLTGLFYTMGGGREFHIFNRATQNPNPNLAIGGLYRGDSFVPTLTGAPVGVLVAATGQILNRHGWQGNIRLGETNGFYLFMGSNTNNNLSGIEPYVLAANRGVTAMIAFYLPSTATAPGAGQTKTFFSKYNSDGVNQRSWLLAWSFQGGIAQVTLFISVDGIAQQIYNSGLTLTPGNAYFIGFSFIASTSVLIWVNDQYSLLTVDSVGAAPIASIFASTAFPCVARRDTTAAGTILGGPDAYYYFCGLSSFRWDRTMAYAFYQTIKPMLLYNSDLSGT